MDAYGEACVAILEALSRVTEEDFVLRAKDNKDLVIVGKADDALKSLYTLLLMSVEGACTRLTTDVHGRIVGVPSAWTRSLAGLLRMGAREQFGCRIPLGYVRIDINRAGELGYHLDPKIRFGLAFAVFDIADGKGMPIPQAQFFLDPKKRRK